MCAAAPASAQSGGPVAHSPVALPESSTITASAHGTAELYAVSVSLIGSAALSAGYGAVRLRSGDVGNPDGYAALLGVPVLAGVGLTLLAIAAGLDGGVAWWSGARATRNREPPLDAQQLAVEQLGMRRALTALYVSGVTSLVVGAVCVGILWGIDLDAQFSHDPGRARIEYGVFVPPGIVGGAGYLMLLAAAGLDVSAGAWSGASTMPSLSVAPMADGGAISIAGMF